MCKYVGTKHRRKSLWPVQRKQAIQKDHRTGSQPVNITDPHSWGERGKLLKGCLKIIPYIHQELPIQTKYSYSCFNTEKVFIFSSLPLCIMNVS